LRKAGNDRTDPLKVWSIKNYKSLPACPTITALVATFDTKSVQSHEVVEIIRGWWKQDY